MSDIFLNRLEVKFHYLAGLFDLLRSTWNFEVVLRHTPNPFCKFRFEFQPYVFE